MIIKLQELEPIKIFSKGFFWKTFFLPRIDHNQMTMNIKLNVNENKHKNIYWQNLNLQLSSLVSMWPLCGLFDDTFSSSDCIVEW
jgi:hypothetical protein